MAAHNARALAALLLFLPWAVGFVGFVCAGDHPHVTFAYSKSALPKGIVRDAQAAAEAWAQRFAQQTEVPLTFAAQLVDFDDVARAVRTVEGSRAYVLILLATDYLAVREKLDVDPFFVPSVEDGPLVELLLVVRRSSGITAVNELKGKSLLIETRNDARFSSLWLNTVLLREGFGEIATFFGRWKPAHKSSAAILPVFFGQFDACLVRRPSFETMVELNPQVGEKLVCIRRSPPMLGGMGCFSRDVSPVVRAELRKFLFEAVDDPIRGQVLLLFQVKSIVPYEPQYLESIEDLNEEYERLKRR